MPTLTLKIDLPKHCKVTEQEAKTALVFQLYLDHKLSAGYGAEILGMTKRTFIETFGTPVLEMTEEEIKKELELVRQFTRHLDKPAIQKKKKEYALP
ncbi:hypothetical protein FACS1894170_13730 [Planctomycetales bacterium]|nr:hypothetical protein FACS1894170_13730 [Planctomycetales bacterium]